MTSTNPASQPGRSPACRRLPESSLLFALLCAVVLCAGVAACGQTGHPTGSRTQVTPGTTSGGNARADAGSASTQPSATASGGYLRSDEDRDNDDAEHPRENIERFDTFVPWTYGKKADRTDKRAVAALVKRYYAAAAAGNGSKGCSLLYSTLAAGLGEGRPFLAGGAACATALSLVFKRQRELLAADDVASMVVIDVRVKGDRGIATVGFKTMPVGMILVRRESGTWKISTLFDTGLG